MPGAPSSVLPPSSNGPPAFSAEEFDAQIQVLDIPNEIKVWIEVTSNGETSGDVREPQASNAWKMEIQTAWGIYRTPFGGCLCVTNRSGTPYSQLFTAPSFSGFTWCNYLKVPY